MTHLSRKHFKEDMVVHTYLKTRKSINQSINQSIKPDSQICADTNLSGWVRWRGRGEEREERRERRGEGVRVRLLSWCSLTTSCKSWLVLVQSSVLYPVRPWQSWSIRFTCYICIILCRHTNHDCTVYLPSFSLCPITWYLILD
jgi:hypothetical protein